MSSEDDVMRLDGEGLSIRAIAKRLGLSRMKVHRTIAAAIEADDDPDPADDDLDAAELVLLDAYDYQPVPPITFVGVVPGNRDHKEDWRYVDSDGHSISSLDLYRYKQALFNSGQVAEHDALDADLERQYAADPSLRFVV